MLTDDTIEKLLFMNKTERASVIKKAWNSYTKLLADIAHDIYRSCIEDYYTSYTPTVYTRHGYPEGKNLYQADAIEWNEHELRIKTAANKLWKYGGKKDKRSRVLSSVLNGYRGSNSSKIPAAWRATFGKWSTSYPNDFSNYIQWDGVDYPTTMTEILNYFAENVVDEAEPIFWEYLSEII